MPSGLRLGGGGGARRCLRCRSPGWRTTRPAARTTCATKLAGPIAYGESAHVDLSERATVPCNESVGPGITCNVGPWATYRAVPTADAAGSGAAPSKPSFATHSLAGLLHHPNAAQIQFAAPFFVDPELGTPTGF